MTLSEALKLLSDKLVQDGKGHFIPLMEEKAVVEAVVCASASYEVVVGTESSPRNKEYMEQVIHPMLRQIAEERVWPEEARLEPFYELTESGVTYRGLSVGIEIATPGKAFPGFSLPILDVWYGRFWPC